MAELWGQLLNKGLAAWRLWRKEPQVAPSPCEVIYRSNKLQLLRYHPDPSTSRAWRTPIVIVPSLINRHYILDLSPGRSLVGFLRQHGFDVYMITWGQPGGEDRFLTFDDCIARLLRRCVLRAMRWSVSPQVSLMGYCMGGTLTAIYAARFPAMVRNLVNLAAPIDFSAAGLLGLWTAPGHLNVDLLVDTLGNAPWPLLQASFHLLIPTLAAQKTLYLYERLENDDFVDHFLSLETWANDNVSFPGECFRRYIKDLYQQNLLVAGKLTIDDQLVDLGRIQCPTLNIVAQGDHIVPEPSATPLNTLIRSIDQTLWLRPGGHIGAIVSKKASRELWPALTQWLAARSTPLICPGAAHED